MKKCTMLLKGRFGEFHFGDMIFILSCHVILMYMQQIAKILCLVASGEVWPGPCAFPENINSKTRFWWAIG